MREPKNSSECGGAALFALVLACSVDTAATSAGIGEADSGAAEDTADASSSAGAPTTTSGADTTASPEASSTSGALPIFDVGNDTDGVVDCECGSTLSHSYIWVANSGESTISKIDTHALVEVGRYKTRADSYGDPSRTSVSLSGLAVAVANRSGGVTKVWADEDFCDPMRNGVPGLQTSTGPNDVRAWGDDDCVAWFADFDYSSQRPIAWTAGTVDRATCQYVGERLWTSGCNKFADAYITVNRLDGDTGVVLDAVEVEGFACNDLGGYGGAADGDGNFWVTNFDPDSTLARIDAETLAVDLYDVPAFVYGITVDHEGRPWMACADENCSALRFDPATLEWAVADDHLIRSQSGIVEDAQGRMWMNYWWYDDTYDGGIAPIDVDTMEVGEPIVTPAQGKGIAVDLDGYVWTVAPQTNSAYRIDPSDGTAETVSGLSNPYTYSDMTGWALQNAACDPAG
jgi:hypothetical protein